ncbi:hypothetical protein APHAL10511_000805 [Amanita phalloides]|nr:hypothetical protein APHAL10511_000805 [Amanita phalloides]
MCNLRKSPLSQDDDYDNYKKKTTPLPWMQLAIVYLIQFAEPLTATVIYPFINQYVRETGITKGDERNTGYYAGIIQSAFFFAEAAAVVPLGMASDRFGRRPILLLGPLGLAFTMLGFGASTRFLPLVFFRCMQGIFNGNIGISKSVISEITDSTNIADAFSFTPVVWTSGVTIGPFIGGILAQPADRWPGVFGKLVYFRSHPYFLPCLAASFLAFSIFLTSLIALRETLSSALNGQAPTYKSKSSPSSSTTNLVADDDVPPRYGSTETTHCPLLNPELENGRGSPSDDDGPFSLRDLLKSRDIQIVLINWGYVAFCDMSVQVLTPLMWSTSIEHGGLGFSPYAIGMTMGTYGLLSAFLQVTFLGKIIKRFGPRRVHITCFSSLIVSSLSFPVASFFARRSGRTDWTVWTMVIISLASQSMRAGAYGAMMVIITGVAPNRSSLGTVNGVGQAVGSITRSLGPSFASSLHSISLQRQLAGGNGVYYIMTVIVVIGVRLTFMLPKKLRLV